jgi:hypothetical protein
VHDGDDPNDLRLVQKYDGVGKGAAEMPACGRIKSAEAFRVGANLAKQPLQLALETHAKLRRNRGIVTHRPREFFVRLRMQ